MRDRHRPRRHSWNRSHSEGFGPIRQVGVATSIGLPLIVIGMFLLPIAISAGGALLWVLAAGSFAAGIVIAGSGLVT
jgi:hypothetical protein